MSIKLRALTQGILDDFGLNMLHVGISSNGWRELQLLTDCGKKFLQINGANFSKKDPVQYEIDYSIVLLKKYITKNLDDIKKLISLKKKFLMFVRRINLLNIFLC